MEWTKKEILDQFNTIKELFTSSKLNVIASLIPNPLNQIHPTNPSGFRIDPIGQNTPYSQVTDHNTPITQNTDIPQADSSSPFVKILTLTTQCM